jgi:cytoskeletal protein RodZ
MAQQPVFAVVVVTAIIVTICQLLTVYNQFYYSQSSGAYNNVLPSQTISDAPVPVVQELQNTADENNNDASSSTATAAEVTTAPLPDDYPYGLTIPKTPARAIPSVRLTDQENAKVERKFYGGDGDKPHLGGFTSFDPMGVSPTLW